MPDDEGSLVRCWGFVVGFVAVVFDPNRTGYIVSQLDPRLMGHTDVMGD